MFNEKPADGADLASAQGQTLQAGDPLEAVTPGDELVRRVLMIGVCAFYAVGLSFFAVMWLAFGHADLKEIVLGGFLGVSQLAAAVTAYYFGTKTATDATRPTLYRTRKAK